MVKNASIRKALVEVGMTHATIAGLLGIHQPIFSGALLNFEFSKNETARVISVIRENAKKESEE